MDSETKIGLPFVHVQCRTSNKISNNDGYFAITASDTDSILISHIGYEDVQIISPGKRSDTINITLRRKTILLREVVVNGVLSEDELKQKVLQTPIVISTEEKNVQENLEDIRTLYALGYRPEMNALDNYREFMKPPKDFTIFSSNGGGLIKALRNIANPPSIKFPTRKTFTKIPAGLTFRARRTIEPDSLVADSLVSYKKELENDDR
jgi:hypothetical protein